MQNIKRQLRACLKIAWGPAARDFGGGQGGEAGASPQRAVTAEPTPANAKRSAARRVFAEKARWLRCSSVTGPGWPCSLVTPCQRAFSAKTGPHGIFRQALTNFGRFPHSRSSFLISSGTTIQARGIICHALQLLV